MEKILIKYRTFYKGKAPTPIKLQMPGWSGEPNDHKDGDVPQPWHCVPFVEGSTYGLEMYWGFDTEYEVVTENGIPKFIGDHKEEAKKCSEISFPPFAQFAPGHFGISSCLDVMVPEGYIVRIEPHPRYYTDETWTTPLAIPGHLNTAMWPKIFFLVFKNPAPGQKYIFRKNDPIAQMLVLPRKVLYDIEEMNEAEKSSRNLLDNRITKLCKHFVTNDWHDYKGNNFNDKYKVLNNIFIRKGKEGMAKLLDDVETSQQKNRYGNIKNKLIIKKKEK